MDLEKICAKLTKAKYSNCYSFVGYKEAVENCTRKPREDEKIEGKCGKRKMISVASQRDLNHLN